MEKLWQVVSVKDIQQYEAFTLPIELIPKKSVEWRTLIMLSEIQIVFFNDGIVSILRPN